MKNLFKYRESYKKNLVVVTASDKFFANSLYQLLDNLYLQNKIKGELRDTLREYNKLLNI